jgi:hypothetical protein
MYGSCLTVRVSSQRHKLGGTTDRDGPSNSQCRFPLGYARRPLRTRSAIRVTLVVLHTVGGESPLESHRSVPSTIRRKSSSPLSLSTCCLLRQRYLPTYPVAVVRCLEPTVAAPGLVCVVETALDTRAPDLPSVSLRS